MRKVIWALISYPAVFFLGIFVGIFYFSYTYQSYLAQDGADKQSVNTSPATGDPVSAPAEDDAAETSGWNSYIEESGAYRFQYPSDWRILDDAEGLNLALSQIEGQDVIQVIDITNPDDGTAGNRENILQMLKDGNYEKIPVADGSAYYDVSQAPGGPVPEAYLVDDEDILLMNYNFYGEDQTSIEEAGNVFKEIVSTFRFE